MPLLSCFDNMVISNTAYLGSHLILHYAYFGSYNFEEKEISCCFPPKKYAFQVVIKRTLVVISLAYLGSCIPGF